MTRAGVLLLLKPCGGPMVMVAALAGCVGPAPMPLAMIGPVDMVLAGQTFVADLQPGPVLSVSRDPAFGNFEGKLAKDVAQQFCAGRASRLTPQTYGRFYAGTWVFDGGCI